MQNNEINNSWQHTALSLFNLVKFLKHIQHDMTYLYLHKTIPPLLHQCIE